MPILLLLASASAFVRCVKCVVCYFRFELAMQQNEIVDIWSNLTDDEDGMFGVKSDTHLKVSEVKVTSKSTCVSVTEA